MHMPSCLLLLYNLRVIQWRGDFPLCCIAQDFFKPSSSPPLLLRWYFSVWCVPVFVSFLCGGSWLGWAIVLAIRALFSLGTGCQKWASLDAPGNQSPFSDAVVNRKLINLLKLLSRNWKLGTQDRWSTGADSRGELSVRCKRFSFTQWQCYSCTWVTKWKLHGKPCRIWINRKIRQTKSTTFRGTRKYMHS